LKSFFVYIILWILLVLPVYSQKSPHKLRKLKKPFSKMQRNRELIILSKPVPAFTEQARRKYVRGNVELNITFDENGKVGEVEVISELPFGLTENAIKAAKTIKFLPQIKNGKKVKVTKKIIYIFDFF
jgi:TonB family protein